MKLGAWMKTKGKTQAWLAKQMKTDQGHVSELVNGKVMPKMGTINKVDKITNGDVSYPDWVRALKKETK